MRPIIAAMTTAKEIGQRIREARLKAELTQDDLARAVGIRMQSVYRYEKEGMDLRSTVAVRLAAALHVSVSWLLTGSSAAVPPPPEYVAFLDASPLGQSANAKEKWALQSIRFPPGMEPTKALYEKLLIDLRSEAKTDDE